MQGTRQKEQYVKRWVAGSLCLLMLWRPLRAGSGEPAGADPLPEAHGEWLSAQQTPPMDGGDVSLGSASVTAEPEQTAAPEDVAAETAAPLAEAESEAEIEAEIEAETEPSAPQPAPQTALEDPSFTAGYALMLSGGEVRLHPHARRTSPVLLRAGAGEAVLVTARVAYQATREERKAQQAGGETFDDWFALRVRDAEGRIVEGYLPGGMLRPMAAEEIEDMRLLWEETLEAEAPVLQDGIPQVSGVYAPPALDVESTPRPTRTAPATQSPPLTEAQPPDQTLSPEEMLSSQEILSPEETRSPEEIDPPLSPAPEPGNAGIAPLEPGAAALLRANMLLAANETFMEEAAAQVAALAEDFSYPPFIEDDIQVLYAQSGSPPVPYAQLHIGVEVWGTAEVYVEGPLPGGERRYCTYDAALARYVLTVYTAGDYLVYAQDLSLPPDGDNPAVQWVTVDPQLTLGGVQDTVPPVIGAHMLWPEHAAVTVLVHVEDEPGAQRNETASGVAEVWLEMEPFDGARIPLQPIPGTDEYVAEVSQNGHYYIFAKDRAGNRTQADRQHAFLVSDATPPLIADVKIDPPDEGNGLVPMVEVSAFVMDVPGTSKDENWVSGLAEVEIGFYYGQDEQRVPQAVDLMPMFYQDELGSHVGYLMENGAYVIVATDWAGNQSFHRLYIDHIGEQKPRKRDPNWEYRMVDDDGDGLFTQTEYRLGLDPFNRDTGGDGLWDGLCVRMGLDARGHNPPPAPSVLSRKADASMLDALVAAGWLTAPLAEEHPGVYRQRVAQEWSKHRNNVVWMHPQGNTLLGINNRTLFAAAIPRTEKVEIERGLSLACLGYGPLNSEVFRTVDPCADGSLALLFDRRTEGGPLTQDAYLIDTLRMRAYRIPGTYGARGLAISSDGAFVAVWRANALERMDLRTGEMLRIDDPERLSRIETLAFLPGNRLITRVNSIGYSALLADGNFEVGNSAALPRLTQFQDLTGLTVYDRNNIPFRIDLELLLRSSGIFVQGEPLKESAIRNLSPRDVYERYARRGIIAVEN